MNTKPTPILFIHAMWLHASSWEPWVAWFRDAGYEPIAPGWPNEAETVAEASAHPEGVANHSIDDLVAYYTAIVDSLPSPPILIG